MTLASPRPLLPSRRAPRPGRGPVPAGDRGHRGTWSRVIRSSGIAAVLHTDLGDVLAGSRASSPRRGRPTRHSLEDQWSRSRRPARRRASSWPTRHPGPERRATWRRRCGVTRRPSPCSSGSRSRPWRRWPSTSLAGPFRRRGSGSRPSGTIGSRRGSRRSAAIGRWPPDRPGTNWPSSARIRQAGGGGDLVSQGHRGRHGDWRHHRTGSRCLSNLADLLQHQPGRLAEARQLAEESLAIKQTLDPGAAEIWTTYNILAQIADQQSRPAEAAEYRRLARESKRRFAGTAHEMRRFAPLIAAVVGAVAGHAEAKSATDEFCARPTRQAARSRVCPRGPTHPRR